MSDGSHLHGKVANLQVLNQFLCSIVSISVFAGQCYVFIYFIL
uniref:Uncharacterized protein MANES_10G067100 n=1 Tax=Rhizophora mucronata TaxID=61149 RepID=A0A2P2K881_RHIMU